MNVERYALFVDVGYVLASTAELLTGSPARVGVTAEYGKLVSSLCEEAGRRIPGASLLRVYWYDATLGGGVTPELAEIAELPNVKLRLGRLVPRGDSVEQKGVDSRLVRDLIVLANDRAISTAVVLAGDEDLVEGVVEAQERGVRLVGLGVSGQNRSRRLVQELDEADVLPDEFWAQSIHVRDAGATPAGTSSVVPASAPGSEAPARQLVAERADVAARDGSLVSGTREQGGFTPFRQAFAVVGVANGAAMQMNMAYRDAAREAGRSFARYWKEMAAPEEVRDVLSGHEPGTWRIPADLDRALLKTADDELGFLWEQPYLKAEVRSGFWEVLEGAA
jgi:uncharacterized LabA/DUF88 family protein